MDIRGKKVCGWDAVVIRNMLRAFNDQESSFTFDNGKFTHHPKRLTAEFVADKLNIGQEEGHQLVCGLIEEGYIDDVKCVPTTYGMALINAEDRDRITRQEATQILDTFLELVKQSNLRTDARVFIEEVHVFGSYREGSETVGDIDLLVISPLPEDCLPEDMDEQDELFRNIRNSEYLSFHDETDPVARAAEKTQVYKR